MSLLEQSDESLMREALKEAGKALAADEVPVGAVVVHQGRIIARAHNQRETLRDPTAHAEMIALTQAAAALDRWRLTGCTLYVTLEPCTMCAGAALLARIDRLVFLNHRLEVTEGILSEACGDLLREFFQRKRRRGIPGEETEKPGDDE